MMKKLCSLLLVLCLVLTIFPMGASAVNDSFETASQISTGSDVTANLASNNDERYYRVSLASDGYITFSFKHEYVDSGNTYWKAHLYTEDYQELTVFSYKGNTAATVTADPIGVPAGVYFIRVEAYYFSSAKFTLRLDYTAASNWETEFNDGFDQYDPMPVNAGMNGNLMVNNDVDFYRFHLTSNGYITFSFKHGYVDSSNTYWKVHLYTEDCEELTVFSYKGNTAATITSDPIGLPAGYYFVRVEDYTFSSLPYVATVNFTSSSKWEAEFNDSFETYNTLAVNAEKNGSIMTNNDEDFFRFSVKYSGMVDITFKHDYLDSSNTYWKMYVYNQDCEEVASFSYVGNKSETVTQNVSLTPGYYYLRVTDYTHSTVKYTLSVVSEREQEAPVITTQPSNASITATGSATFKVAASGSGLKYRWQYKTPSGSWTDCSSATKGYNTATLTVAGSSGTTFRNNYQYRCKVTGSNGKSAFSNAAKLTVTGVAINGQPKSATAVGTNTAKFSVTAAGSGLTYQWQYKLPSSSTWQNCTSATTGYHSAVLTVAGVSGTTNRNGYQYRCVVKNSSGTTKTSSAATLTVFAIQTQPKSASVTGSATASFTVKATGDGLTYQWQYKMPSSSTWKNCTSATTGYHSATLKVVGVSGGTNRNGYQYRCVVKDSAGHQATSSAAKLTVKTSTLTITESPKSATVSTGSTVAFNVKASGTGLTYQWQYKAPGSDWANCTSATTGYHSATLKVEAIARRDGYRYRCIVKDASGNTATSSAATLTVE